MFGRSGRVLSDFVIRACALLYHILLMWTKIFGLVGGIFYLVQWYCRGWEKNKQFGRNKKTKGSNMKKLALTSLLAFFAVSGAQAATMAESGLQASKDYFVGVMN